MVQHLSLTLSSPVALAPAGKAISVAAPASLVSPLVTLGSYLYENPIVIASLIAGCIAVVVGLLTLSGVVVSLIYAHKRMKEELFAAASLGLRNREHSREEATKEREHSRAEAVKDRQHSADEAHKERLMEARKAVYMSLIDGFMETIGLFASLPTIDFIARPDFNHKLLDLGASINKTWLVSEVDTAVKARELHARLNELFMRLMTRVPAFQALKNQIAQAQRTSDAAAAERDRLIAALHDNKNFNANDPQVMAGLMQSQQAQLAILANAATEIADAHKKHLPLAREHGQYLMSQLGDLMNLIQDLMLSARIELGLQGDNEILKQQTIDMYERAKRAVAELTAQISV